MRGPAAIARAVKEWERGIFDPPVGDASDAAARCRGAITAYIREGLGWRTWTDELTEKETATYGGDRTFAWCGAFAAHAWAPFVDRSTRTRSFASTFKLHELGDADPRWRVGPEDIAPGDIVVVGDDDHRWGEHIALALRAPVADWIPTIEGNGTGLVRWRGQAQGVVLGMRALKGVHRVRFAYRPPEEP
jgi:hypothetical protein